MNPYPTVPSGWQLELTDQSARYAMKYFAWTMFSGSKCPDEPDAFGLPANLASDIRSAAKAMEKALANAGE